MSTTRSNSGFTLLEVMVAVVLMALLMGALATRLGGGFGVHLSNSGRRLAAELEYVGQRAITTGRPHRFVIDMQKQACRIEEQRQRSDRDVDELPAHFEDLDLSIDLASQAFSPIEASQGDWRWLDDGEVAFDEIVIGNESFTSNEISIGFSPDGGAEPAQIWLVDDGGYSLQVRLVAFTGEVHVEEGEE